MANSTRTLSFQEKSLYHQIHPLKLATDIGMTFPSMVLLWQHELIFALVVTFVPSIIVSALILRFANLEPYKDSRLGHYIKHYMSSLVVASRVIGLLVMMVGAWFHIFWLILLGLAIIILAWLRGVLLPDRSER